MLKENREEKVIEKINFLIERCNEGYEKGTASRDTLDRWQARIDGMLEALEMMTGKSYTYDSKGIKEN